MELAQYLKTVGLVEEVYYPGLPEHPHLYIKRDQAVDAFEQWNQSMLTDSRVSGKKSGDSSYNK